MFLRNHIQQNVRRDLIALNPLVRPPQITKILVNHTSQQILSHPETVVPMCIAFELITGQKPFKVLAKHSVAPWNLRKGNLIGCKVTLRGDKAIDEFVSKLVDDCLPRMNRTRNFSAPFPLHQMTHNPGSLSIGIPSLYAFPDIEKYASIFRSSFPSLGQFGCHVTFVTDSTSMADTVSLLRSMKIPIDYRVTEPTDEELEQMKQNNELV